MKARNLRIGYLSLRGTSDPRSDSGTPFFIAKALENSFGEVVDLSPAIYSRLFYLNVFLIDPVYFSLRVYQRIFRKLPSPIVYRSRFQKKWAAQIDKRLNSLSLDVIYADKCSFLLRYLKTKLPIIYRSDATFSLLKNYYPSFITFSPSQKKNAELSESIALKRSDIFVPASEWAGRGACEHYGFKKDKCVVVRSHSSLLSTPSSSVKSIDKQRIKFLFIGAEWNRKGGACAIDLVQRLLTIGYCVEIVLVCRNIPHEIANLDFVTVVEFIDRSTPEGESEYRQLYLDATFFILPTSAECLGQVFIDALMAGLPAIAYATGGVPEAVVDGTSGILFKIDASPDEMVGRIIDTIENPTRYEALSKGASELYHTEFSYEIWHERMSGVFRQVLD